MKAVVAAFNQEKAVIVKTSQRFVSSSTGCSIGHGETEVLSVALRDHGDGGME